MIGVGAVLAALAVVDLAEPTRLGGIRGGFVATSPYTWVAIASPGANGLVATHPKQTEHREHAE